MARPWATTAETSGLWRKYLFWKLTIILIWFQLIFKLVEIQTDDGWIKPKR